MFADRLKKSLLQAAIQGQLTEQLQTDGDARDLLRKIRAEKTKLIATKKIKAEKPLPTVTDDEIPFDIPESWCWVRLGDVCDTNIGLTYSPQNIVDNGIDVLRSGNIVDGRIDYKDLVKVNLAIPENKLAYVGNILICVRNGSKRLVGKAAIIDKDGVSFGAFMAVIRSAIAPYIFKVISSPYFRRTLIDDVGTTTINQITQSMLKNFLIPLPPLAEQTRIVEKLDVLLSEVDELAKDEHELIALEETFPRRMKNSLLQAAIQGKLTEQLPSDGDARDLIRKIRTEKAKLLAKKKIKAEKTLPPVTDDEILFDLPDNWFWCRLGDVCEMYTGNSIAESEKKAKYLGLTDGFSYIGTKDISFDSRINYDNGVRIPFENNFRRAKKNSILMCIEGGSAGRKIAITDRDVCFGNKLCNFNAEKISNRDIYFYLQSSAFKKFFVDNVTGIIGGVSLKRLNLIPFPLPPLDEQKRIVERLEDFLPLFTI